MTIRVDKATAAVLNASLAKINAEGAPQKALFDFEHEHKQAMAWPVGFAWQDGPAPGVYASAEFSQLGKDYVEGKVVRAFSGSFFTDAEFPKRKELKAGKIYEVKDGKRGSEENPARITGLNFPYAGTLTNNPAFDQNQPLWATATRRGQSKEAAGSASEERIKAVERYYK